MPTRALVLACVWLGAAGTVPEWGDWLPPSEGWHNLMNKRAAQIARLPDSQQRFDGYIGLAISGILTPNFTTLGFAGVCANVWIDQMKHLSRAAQKMMLLETYL